MIEEGLKGRFGGTNEGDECGQFLTSSLLVTKPESEKDVMAVMSSTTSSTSEGSSAEICACVTKMKLEQSLEYKSIMLVLE